MYSDHSSIYLFDKLSFVYSKMDFRRFVGSAKNQREREREERGSGGGGWAERETEGDRDREKLSIE